MSNLNWFSAKYWKGITQLFRKRSFGKIEHNSVLFKPMRLDDTKSIEIGKDVFIAEGSWLMGNKGKETTLRIGDKTVIGNHAHIVAKKSVIIEKNVLIADKIFITDCSHEYADITKPVIDQPVKPLQAVSIGEGAWLGENVCVCGASIGKHCVIGANSVVTHDIPDYSVAAGAPARVVKHYDFEKKEWVKD